MNYHDHKNAIKLSFPELELHLLDESEFQSFKNENFAKQYINSCIELCNNASDKLEININFGVKYDYSSNAQATVKGKRGVILLNLGLIEKLESIISDSIEIFSMENVSRLTIQENDKTELKALLSDLCFSYIFYHELAHILQLTNASSDGYHNFQELYIYENKFDVRKHLYEIDADNFGICMSMSKLIDYASNKNYPISTVLIFNLLTLFVFSIANIIIEFSKNQFNDIYYKSHSHPHPLIRIVKCSERIVSFASDNLNIKEELSYVVLQRSVTMMSQIQYSNGVIDYLKLLQDNISDIEIYNNEIEVLNESYRELIRFRIQKLFNSLLISK
ncbi:hypothetical protein [Flavobacterium chungangense]|uniref:Uncharacterized protein n=1 Tax=Flavobacterium chungangense TaxID=554283 RepID=A0A6V6Z540_9FLAO|nr:hypothetical protein [Flavobacterium chungangense]CAD0006062.1 hypothetical protein FLACHUCJ7_02666 [Flavobacterium chungangense]